MLATVGLTDEVWRSDEFSVEGSYEYSLTAPGTGPERFRDGATGEFRSSHGTVTWSSPTQATGRVEGMADGSGQSEIHFKDLVTGAEWWEPCSTYSLAESGSADFAIDGNTISWTSLTVGSASFTSYVQHLDHPVCEADPTAQFFGGDVSKYAATFRSTGAQFLSSIDYREATADEAVLFSVPDTEVEFADRSANELSVAIVPYDEPVAIPSGWIRLNPTAPNLPIETVDIEAGLSFIVNIEGKAIHPPGGDFATPIGHVELEWMNGNLPAGKIPLSERANIFWNSRSVKVTVTDFPEPPVAASHVRVKLVLESGVPDGDSQNNSVKLLIDNWKVGNSAIGPFDEDNATAGYSAPGGGDGIDPRVALLAYNPVSTLGAHITAFKDKPYVYDPTAAPGLQKLSKGEVVTDAFEFLAIKDGGLKSFGWAAQDVHGRNDAPVAGDDAGATDEDSLLVGAGLLTNDIDIDVDGFSPDDTIDAVAESLTSDQGVVVTIFADGSYHYDPTSSQTIQSLAEGDSLTDTFTYTLRDNHDATDIGIVSISVNGKNDAPTAQDLSLVTTQDTPVSADVLGGSDDPEGSLDAGSVKVIVAPSNGETSVSSVTGKITFTPDPGFVGADEYAYQVCDAEGLCAAAIVTIEVEEDEFNAWHNQEYPVDVDGNGRLRIDDAFVSVDAARNGKLGPLNEPSDSGALFLDVNNNRAFGIDDVLQVIDAVRNLFAAAGESESESREFGPPLLLGSTVDKKDESVAHSMLVDAAIAIVSDDTDSSWNWWSDALLLTDQDKET